MGNYPRERTAASLFVNSVNLSFLMKFESDVIKEVSSSKISDSLATVKLSINGTCLFCL